MNTKPIVQLVRSRYEDHENVAITPSHALDARAKLAIDLIERWGLTSAPAPEVNSGESDLPQHCRLIPNTELAMRAFNMADIVYDMIKTRGWYVDVPAPRHQPEVPVPHINGARTIAGGVR